MRLLRPRAIIRIVRAKTQQQTVWKSVENLVNSHAAGMVQVDRPRANEQQVPHRRYAPVRNDITFVNYATTAA
jgi:hypothetical protein